MLPITLDPYWDPIFRRSLERAARRRGLSLGDVERTFRSADQAFEWLRTEDADEFTRYIEDTSVAVDHVGWIIVDRRRRRVAL